MGAEMTSTEVIAGLVMLIAIAIAAWVTQDRWLHRGAALPTTLALPSRDPNVHGSCKAIPCSNTAEWLCAICRRPICRANHAKWDENGGNVIVCKGIAHMRAA